MGTEMYFVSPINTNKETATGSGRGDEGGEDRRHYSQGLKRGTLFPVFKDRQVRYVVQPNITVGASKPQ